jgi:hypothetical protein
LLAEIEDLREPSRGEMSVSVYTEWDLVRGAVEPEFLDMFDKMVSIEETA